ncbi:MAG TPA: hypothetical protein VIJ15_14900 [Dermatophilaceae bacterium]
MNDPDRWRPYDGFDDDAIFADIVAHLNDDVAEIEQRARPAAENPAAEIDTHEQTRDQPTDPVSDGPPPDGPPPDAPPPGEALRNDPDRWPVNEPPEPPALTDPPAVSSPQVWRAHEVGGGEEHFEPPPVTPLPAGDLAFWAIIAGMGGGPLLLLYFVFFNRYASGYWTLLAIAMSVGGFALLVSRMPSRHDEDDDGARL